VPWQVILNGGSTGTALQGKLSTPTVVGMKARGMLPGAVSFGPADVTATAAEAMQVIVPLTSPVTVVVSPGRVQAGTPGSPLSEGGLAAETVRGVAAVVNDGTAV